MGLSLKERVSGRVRFVRFTNTDAKQELWYECDDGFQFPITGEDLKGAEFLAEDKGMLYMRWIRKHMEFISTTAVQK